MQLVLLIEDDPASGKSVMAHLRRAGAEAMLAASAADGLKMVYLHHQQIMFVLVDIGLPDGNGFELVRAIRADPYMADVPFVVITASREPDIEQQAALLNIEHILYKPVTYPQISAMVERYQSDTG